MIKELEAKIKELETNLAEATDAQDFERVLNIKENLYKNKLELIKIIKKDKRRSLSISASDLFKKQFPKHIYYECGIRSIDKHLGGIPSGAFIQIAAGSGAGKTTLMLKILSTLSGYRKILHFDFEMGEYKLQRLLPNYLKTDTQKENYLINTTSYRLDDLILEIEYQTKQGVKIFMIDSRMKIETSEKDTYKSASLVSKELSKLSRENNITIMLINQISEEALKTGYASLKGSGDQVYDSDIILYIYRIITKKASQENPAEFDENKRKIVCKKNRFGNLFDDYILKSEVMDVEYDNSNVKVIEAPEI